MIKKIITSRKENIHNIYIRMLSNCTINNYFFDNCKSNSSCKSKKACNGRKKSEYEKLVVNSIHKTVNSWYKDMDKNI